MSQREGNNVVDDNTNHRGERKIFVIMSSIDILEELRTFNEDIIDQRRHQAKRMVKRKVVGTADKIASSESKLPFETTNIMLKARFKFSVLM